MRGRKGFRRLLEKYPILYSLFILGGIWIVYCAIKRPSSYWESEKNVDRRKKQGDNMVIILDSMKGLFLIMLGAYFLANAY